MLGCRTTFPSLQVAHLALNSIDSISKFSTANASSLARFCEKERFNVDLCQLSYCRGEGLSGLMLTNSSVALVLLWGIIKKCWRLKRSNRSRAVFVPKL